jgi:hypothetical protein
MCSENTPFHVYGMILIQSYQQAAAVQAVTINNCDGNIACNCQDVTFLGLMENTVAHNCTAVDGQSE